jgi:hypothetical protein
MDEVRERALMDRRLLLRAAPILVIPLTNLPTTRFGSLSLPCRPRVTATGAAGVSRPDTSGVVVSGADVP